MFPNRLVVMRGLRQITFSMQNVCLFKKRILGQPMIMSFVSIVKLKMMCASISMPIAIIVLNFFSSQNIELTVTLI